MIATPELLVSLTLAAAAAAQLAPSPPSPSNQHGALGADHDGRALFAANRGQWHAHACFRAERCAPTTWLRASGITFDLRARDQSSSLPRRSAFGQRRVDRPARQSGTVVQMDFEDANTVEPQGRRPTPSHFSYFLGNDPSQWASGVPAFGEILYANLYDGVDLVVRSEGPMLEYDFVVAAHRDVASIVVVCRGHEDLALSADGSLAVTTRHGVLRHHAPVAWTTAANGQRTPVKCRFHRLTRDRFCFQVPYAPPDQPLTIDPGLEWSTYLGGNDDEACTDLVVEGDIVTTVGVTESMNFPTTPGAYDTSYNIGKDVFVTQIDRSRTAGAQMVWSTFVGGSNEDQGLGIARTPSGYMMSGASRGGFPIPPGNPFQSTHGGGLDAVVFHLTSDGTTLTYATYLGGTNEDFVWSGVIVEPNGRVTIAGDTASNNFPTTTNAFSRQHGGGDDAFVATLDPALAGSAQLTYASYLGSTGQDTAYRAAIDDAGIVVVVGGTGSSRFPVTPGSFSFNGGVLPYANDGFISKIDRTRSGTQSLVWSTFYGGTGSVTAPQGDYVTCVATRPNGKVVIAGLTDSQNIPLTPNAWDNSYNGNGDAFLTYLDTTQIPMQSVIYGTLLGGSEYETAWDLTVDSADVAIVAGWTYSSDYPTTSGAYSTAVPARIGQMLVTEFNRKANKLTYSTYLGGATAETLLDSLVRTSTGLVIVSGRTPELNYPVVQPYQAMNRGARDGVLTALDMLPTGAARVGSSTASCQGPVVIDVTEAPIAPAQGFAITTTSAPPLTVALCLIAQSPLTPGVFVPGLNFTLFVANPVVSLSFATDADGYGVVPIPLSAGVRGQVALQCLFANTTQCGIVGTLSASTALVVVVR